MLRKVVDPKTDLLVIGAECDEICSELNAQISGTAAKIIGGDKSVPLCADFTGNLRYLDFN